MKKNYLFIGFAIPNDEIIKTFSCDKFPSIQTHKFIWNFIKGVEFYNKYDFTYISSRPISEYPYFPYKIIKKREWKVGLYGRDINITEVPFINTGILKIITRFISGLYYSIIKYHNIKNKGGVIVYSVHVPFMLIGYIISRIYKVDYIAIWTDPPSICNERESMIKSKLRNTEFVLSKFIMKRVTRVIALTKYLAIDFAPNKPYLVIEGIIDKADLNKNIYTRSLEDKNPIKVLYTGSIEKRYGINNIVEAFKLLKNENIIIEIYGRGDYEEELIKICNKYDKIKYKGFVSNEKILYLQRKADFLINARSSEDEFVKYSFPSKTLEYMLSGTPLITTMLPGIPEEYRDFVLILDNNKVTTIKKKLQDLLEMKIEERYLFGLKAKALANNKNFIHQGRKIVGFI